MKKLAAILCLSFTATWASAIPDRLFELGTDATIGVGNSYFAFEDFFQPTLVIDLNEMADSFSDQGLAFSTDAKLKSFFNLNLSEDFRLGFFFQTGASGYSNIPKAFFELAAQGNELDKTYKGVMNLRGDLTAELGASFGTQLFGFNTTVGTSYFIPLVHLEKPTAQYTFKTSSDGKLMANVDADIPVYAVSPLEEGLDMNSALTNLFKSGGLDFSVAADYPLLPGFLIVGGELQNIPLWPARLVDRTLMKATMEFTMNDLANNFDSGSLTQTDSSQSWESDKAPINVLRPFKMGTHAVFTPLGDPILAVIPNLGVGVYGDVYPEFGLMAEANLWKWLIFRLGTQFEDRLWKQKAALNINVWLLEIDLGIAGQSQEIGNSFGSGVSANVGFRVGF